ncbi:hypothetical protein [Emcibacter nanhaiensis]|uniref:General secretion pathway protein GspK n=1 Tax=Emcibacter nanhaiensis TaxID=1505037 RepID=A0A501PG74_9PROT|nr:hypothetical protein [Emcibacter nanhaiensis]TPD58981.1 hypothetical protein FIV46_12150 [Emcibacter nanhaiensis]
MTLKRTNKSSDQGIALISVLWGVLVLSLIAMTVLALARVNSHLAKNMIEQEKANAASEAALYEVIRRLSSPSEGREIKPVVGTTTVNFEGYTIEVAIEPERGKIDLNSADPLLISAALAYRGMEEDEALDMAAHIAELRENSPEKVFRVVSDLLQKADIPENIYHCAAPFFTVYTGVIGVDHLAATEEIKELLQWADKKRWGGRNWMEISGTSSGGLVSEATNSVVQNSISHSGRVYTLIARVKSQKGGFLQKRAIVRLTGNRKEPFWVYAWRAEFSRESECSQK